jgi:hypothetical protein
MAEQEQITVWEPQPQQSKFITCPLDDVAFGGARGGGKSDAVIGDFISHEDEYGEAAIGLAVRRNRVQLVELIERAKMVMTPLGYEWKTKENMFVGPKRGRWRFAYLENDSDADEYQGHSYTRIYPEEMGTFPSETPINKLQATLRSGHGVPCQMKGTCNPGGPGHQWVKARYRLDTHPRGMEVFEDRFKNPFSGEVIIKRRVFIPSKVSDNRYLGSDYVANLFLVGNEQLVRAWLDGDWSIIAGAFFPEFRADLHVIKPFSIPKHWSRIRAGDWGSAKPFSIGWYAVSDGELPQFPRGALIKYREWYGIAKDKDGRFKPNEGLMMTAEEVGRGIKEMEAPGECGDSVLDPSTFSSNGGPPIAERMDNGWRPADNARVGRSGAMGGWDQLRSRLVGTCGRDPHSMSVDWSSGRPMIYFFESCEHTIRTLPALQHDQSRPEDIDSDAEDHAADETRYACMSRPFIRDSKQTPTIETARFPVHRNINEMIAERTKRRKAAYL